MGIGEHWVLFEKGKYWAWSESAYGTRGAVVSCYLGKVFHYWARRTAWWSTESNLYPAGTPCLPTLDAARAAVEQARTQGTQWRIMELPTLVAVGQDHAVAIVEINTTEPLDGFALPDGPRLTLAKLGSYFQPTRPNSVFRIVCDADAVPVARLPFHLHRSEPGGSRNVRLKWQPEAADIGVAAIGRHVTAINEALQRAARQRTAQLRKQQA